jgi:hypothetical protein
VDLTFANGSTRQQTQWRQALDHLLTLPMDAVPISIDVSFVSPSTLTSGHLTDLAETTWTYGSSSSQTKVRNDAPGYGNADATLRALAAQMGLQYNADIHFNETAVHEFFHSLYAALPEEKRVAIAALFGAESDSIEELAPPGSAWEDRIIEGIAETGKEAFLPRRYRIFPNRTNRRIPYSKFPEFRSLWRLSMPEVFSVGGEPLGPGEEEVPGYNLDIFKQGGYEKTERFEDPFAPELGQVGEYLIGVGGFWDTMMREVYVGLPWKLVGSFIQAEFSWEAWVKDGITLKWELPLSLAPFEQDGTAVTLEIFRPVPSSKTFFDGRWIRADEAPDGFTREGDATSFLPPTTVSDSMVVNGTNFGTTTIKCHEETYRHVALNGFVKIDLFAHHLAEHEALRQALLYSWLAPFPFIQAACTEGGEPGQAIELPSGLIVPGDQRVGVHPTRRPVVGN